MATQQPRNLYNHRAEAALVASAIVNEPRMLLLDVRPSDFHDQELGRLWALMQSMYEAGEYVDPITLEDAITARGVDVRISRLVSLQGSEAAVASPVGMEQYAAIVKRLATARKVEAAA